MNEKEINKIMENITEDGSLCIIREALRLYENDKELEVNLSEEDLQDLQLGKDFHWRFEGVNIHLFKAEDF